MTRVPTEADLATPLDVPRWSLRDPRWLPWPAGNTPRVRAILDNDFAGDPDDLPQLVHQLLSPSVELRAIVCSHDQDWEGRESAAEAHRVARDVFRRMGLEDTHLLHRGSDRPIVDAATPRHSPGVDAILAEAGREDDRPLLFLAGAGFTDLASAYLIDPSIAAKMTVIWIGGIQHDEVVGRPVHYTAEYNRDVDRAAAQIVFAAGFEIWQVARDLYRKCVMAESELRERVGRAGGPVGRYIVDEVTHVLDQLAPRIGRAEMYPMGDQPLVLLSVLQGGLVEDDDFSSNAYVTKPAPRITDDGRYLDVAGARSMRVYTDLDHRLMFEDLYLKLAEFARWQAGEGGA